MVDLPPIQLQLLNKELDINLPPINQELEPIKAVHQDQEHQEHPEQQDMEQPHTHHQE